MSLPPLKLRGAVEFRTPPTTFKVARGTRRDPRVFDSDGNEVLVTLICPHCHVAKPLRLFGLRRMGDGTIRNCPWCRACRSGWRKP